MFTGNMIYECSRSDIWHNHLLFCVYRSHMNALEIPSVWEYNHSVQPLRSGYSWPLSSDVPYSRHIHPIFSSVDLLHIAVLLWENGPADEIETGGLVTSRIRANIIYKDFGARNRYLRQV